MNNKEIKNRMNVLYNTACKKYGISNRAVLWDDQQTQYFRFHELIKHINLNDAHKTLLDIGCGNGELYKFLNFLGFRGTYTGYDINKQLIKQAKKRFPSTDFENRDIMDSNVEKRFDCVVCSGLFNANIGQSLEWVQAFIVKMYDLTSDSLVFNMVSDKVNYRDDTMFYVNPGAMLSFCINKISPRVILEHHNLPYNFTVIVFRNEKWNSVNR